MVTFHPLLMHSGVQLILLSSLYSKIISTHAHVVDCSVLVWEILWLTSGEDLNLITAWQIVRYLTTYFEKLDSTTYIQM